jgi:hypothetical protein
MIAEAHLALGLGGRLTASGADPGRALASDAALGVTIEAELRNAYAHALALVSGARRAVRLVADAHVAKRLRVRGGGADGGRHHGLRQAEAARPPSPGRPPCRRVTGSAASRAALGPGAGEAAARACRIAIARTALAHAEAAVGFGTDKDRNRYPAQVAEGGRPKIETSNLAHQRRGLRGNEDRNDDPVCKTAESGRWREDRKSDSEPRAKVTIESRILDRRRRRLERSED